MGCLLAQRSADLQRWRQHAIYPRIDAAWGDLRDTEWFLDFRLGFHDDKLAEGTPTFVYVFLDEQADAVKIGVSTDPKLRLGQAQVGNPRELMLVVACPATVAMEKYMHSYLSEWRVRGEWFALSTEVLCVLSLLMAAEDTAVELVESGEGPANAEDSAVTLSLALHWAEAVFR